MKKTLRKSQFADYVAVDLLNKDGQIVETPIYLQKNKPVNLLAFDVEENKYVTAKVIFDGRVLKCDDGEIYWESTVDELIGFSDNGMSLFKAKA